MGCSQAQSFLQHVDLNVHDSIHTQLSEFQTKLKLNAKLFKELF